MAKIKPTIIKVSGKIGNDVIVDSKTYGHHVRKAPAKGSKKNEAALKQQYSRTKFLNALASELNTVIKGYSVSFKSSGFYQRMQKLFRKEPLDKRFLLLQKLKDMEIN